MSSDSPDIPYAGLGEMIARARRLMGAKPTFLAKAMGVSRQTWYDWENGVSRPDHNRWGHLEGLLGLRRGSIAAATQRPLDGPSLDYWIGRWEQHTDHFERLLREQRELVQLMRDRSVVGATPAATGEELEAATARQLKADAKAARTSASG